MLQQTRVAAVIPYYERFLGRFPDARTLAEAPEDELLAMWAGLGYYSRARNLQKAAKQLVEQGRFPEELEALLELAGVGEYTAAAIASIAFGRPHAVVDGNVRRVMARIANEGAGDPKVLADELLDRRDPAAWNQAVMELGALICLPKQPLCESCPVREQCGARAAGTQAELPRKRAKPEAQRIDRTLLLIQRGDRVLMTPSPRVNGFWDLPERIDGSRVGATLGAFSHTITFRNYRFTVQEAKLANGSVPKECRWLNRAERSTLPLSTTAKKAFRLAGPIDLE